MRGRSYFDLDGPVRGLWPREYLREWGVSRRTADGLFHEPGFPKGEKQWRGRIEVRILSPEEVVAGSVWLGTRQRGLGSLNARRRSNLEEARSVRLAKLDLGQLAVRLVYVAGAEVLAETLRPLGHADRGLKAIPKDQVATVRAAIVRAITLHGGRP